MIIHQAILVAVAYYMLMLAIPPVLQFAAIVIFSVLLTFACYEILRKSRDTGTVRDRKPGYEKCMRCGRTDRHWSTERE